VGRGDDRAPALADRVLRRLRGGHRGVAAARPAAHPGTGLRPGLLAAALLDAFPDVDYVGLDVSAAMHVLARERIGAHLARVRQVERSLRDADWPEGLGSFDFVVTHQAVHELRHQRHARGLHAQVASLLAPGGAYLVCDHFLGEGGMSNGELYMTADEQRQALLDAGFGEVERVLLKGDLVLHRAGR
jgi:hypothetical protein